MRSLANVKRRLSTIARVEQLTPAEQRRWGRMTVAGMICHCADAFRFALGEMEVKEASSLVQRTLVKRAALYLPMRWPTGVPTRPELDQGIEGTPPGDFDEDREALLNLLARFSANGSALVSRHPNFGPMTRAEWMRWGYLHMDHHLRQSGDEPCARFSGLQKGPETLKHSGLQMF